MKNENGNSENERVTVLAHMAQMYDKYFASGFYSARYPHPNQNTLGQIRRLLTLNSADILHVLDYGCGNGRYLLPLLKEDQRLHFTAYDIAATPLEQLNQRLQDEQEVHRVCAIQGSISLLEEHLQSKGKADIILLMFGVLSHLGERSERLRVLRLLRGYMQHDQGRLILSVPNRRRRFRHRDRDGSKQQLGDIIYSRLFAKRRLSFFYHLYTPEELGSELKECGYRVLAMRSESLLPESIITRFPSLGYLDRLFSHYLPARYGYGILAVVAPDV